MRTVITTTYQRPVRLTPRCGSVPASKEYIHVQNAIAHAKAVCEEATDELECIVAWDSVDDVMRGVYQRIEKTGGDPLDKYCDILPDADECREYDL